MAGYLSPYLFARVHMFIDLLIFMRKDVTEIEQEQAQAAMEESILK